MQWLLGHCWSSTHSAIKHTWSNYHVIFTYNDSKSKQTLTHQYNRVLQTRSVSVYHSHLHSTVHLAPVHIHTGLSLLETNHSEVYSYMICPSSEPITPSPLSFFRRNSCKKLHYRFSIQKHQGICLLTLVRILLTYLDTGILYFCFMRLQRAR